MRNLLNPKWLYIINTAPIVLLFFLAAGEYNIIKTELEPEIGRLWAVYAITLGALAAANFAYITWLVRKKQELSLAYGIVSLIAFIAYLYFYAYNADDLIPWSVPTWMVSDNILVYGGTFLMPTLAYSLFIIIVKLTPKNGGHSAVQNFFGAVGVPILFYIFYQVMMSLWRADGGKSGIHVLIITTICATVLFLFFLIRTVYIIALRKDGIITRYRLAWRIPIALLFPILGLLVNNGWEPGGWHQREGYGIFGDFGSPWFYIITAVNALLLCMPVKPGKYYRLALFAGKAVTFSFTLYFFMVFLPFLPLSVIAIIAVGLGFLMLAPIMLFLVHVRDLAVDYNFLQPYFSRAKRTAILVAGILVLPVCITADYMHDKLVLNQALAYVYEPDYSKDYSIDEHSLGKTLDVVKVFKDRNGRSDFLESRKQPYLTSYFNWLVLDNLTLSDSKIQTLEKIFFGKSDIHIWNRNNEASENVVITGINQSAQYDPVKQQWESTIDLELTNYGGGLSEYQTTLSLPDGCWINDYYLYVGDRKEKGILAEKKLATWVYSQIRNASRDPGILFYNGGNRVAFHVFPFAVNEVRKTGISFIHKEPVKLTIDGRTLQLGQTGVANPAKTVEAGPVVYIPASEKETLKKVKRKPYLHFIVDVSAGKSHDLRSIGPSMDRMIQVCKYESEYGIKPVVSFANTYMDTPDKNEDWRDEYEDKEFRGGFFAERAIRKVLVDSYNKASDTFPVIVLVTDSIDNAIIEKDFSDLAFTFPDNAVYYVSGRNGYKAYSLERNPRTPLDSVTVIPHKEALAWPATGKPQRYLRNDSLPQIMPIANGDALKDDVFKTHDWHTGLIQQGEYLAQVLHPETTSDTWLPQVKHSFASGIMSPHTSYMVVETEAQKAILKKKQEQVRSGNSTLDLDDEVQGMDEPGLLLLLGLFGAYLLMRNKYRRKKLS